MIGYIKTHKKLVAVILIVVAIGAFFIFRTKTAATKVTESKVEKRTITKMVSASGETKVTDGSTKYSIVSATVKKVNLANGTEVKKGQAIVDLDPVSLKAAADSAYSSYLLAKSGQDTYQKELSAARANVDAKKRLNIVAKEKYDSDRDTEDKNVWKSAEASLKGAEAELAMLQSKETYTNQNVSATYATYISAWTDFKSSSVVSPVDGILALEGINEGQQVMAGTKLFSVVNPKNIVFEAEVDETDVRLVSKGQKVEISLDSYGDEKISGTLAEVGAKTVITDSGATAVKVKVAIEKEDVLKIIGLSGDIKIMTQTRENVLTLPVEYIDEDEKGPYGWKIKDGKANKVRIEEGLVTDDFAEVKETTDIFENAQFVRGDKLTEGAKVTVSTDSTSK